MLELAGEVAGPWSGGPGLGNVNISVDVTINLTQI